MGISLEQDVPRDMPPLSDVLKSRDVEDPINLWLHRPLAYLFCWLVYRTRVSPNQLTLLAVMLGVAASICWVEGSPVGMLWGGVLLWSSAIMDGADGILARARGVQSAFGRALDGSADWIVGLCSVSACIYHLYREGASPTLMWLTLPAIALTALQFNLFDFYKELWLHMTRTDRTREGHSVNEVQGLRASREVHEGPWHIRLSMALYEDYTRLQDRLIGRTNPRALQLLHRSSRSRETAEIYRDENRAAMSAWKPLSTAPHAYLFAIFGMFDRLDLYVVLRLGVMGSLMVIALVAQRGAPERTLARM